MELLMSSSIKFYDANGEYHCDDGPAIITSDGSKFWYRHGRIHRDDGPACEYTNGLKYFYLNGKFYPFKEKWFQQLTSEQQYNYFWNIDNE